MYTISFDGSCLNNGQPDAKAGWAFLAKNENGKVIYQANGPVSGKQTNNRAEIIGLLMSLKWLRVNPDKEAIITGDSKLVIDSITGLSMRRANRDLWEQVEEVFPQVRKQLVEIKHIKREFNSQADKLAKRSASSLL